jgi:phosphinothricin acetyltransferase
MNLRDATEADLSTLLAIYNDAVVHTTASYDYTPRTPDKQQAWWAAKQAGGWPVLVADLEGTVAGFASYGAFRAWDGYRFTVEHSVYVDGRFRRRGIASALLQELLGRAAAQGMHLMVGAIDAANEASIALHRRHGFEDAGVLREAGCKFGRWLDLAFMTRRLVPGSPPGAVAVFPPARG